MSKLTSSQEDGDSYKVILCIDIMNKYGSGIRSQTSYAIQFILFISVINIQRRIKLFKFASHFIRKIISHFYLNYGEVV